jgi:Putative quorum-sensing-regulated virulence factor
VIRMPFGKYKGELVCEIPDEYVEWLHSLDDLREPLRSAIRQEWQLRFEVDDRTTADTRRMAEAIIATGYRALALEHHPDRGGATATMQAVNAAASWLRQAVRMVSA